MKKALLVTLDYPPQLGGVAEHLASLVAVLGAGRIDVLAPARPDAAGSPGVQRAALLSAWLRPRWLPALWQVLRRCLDAKTRPSSIVVSHLLPVGEIARAMKALFGIPYVVLLHGYDIALAADGGWLKRRRAARVLRGAASVIANSAYTAAIAARVGAPAAALSVAYPCPAEAVRRSAEAPAARESAAGIRLFVACRLIRRKAVDVTLSALSQLAAQGVEFSLVIAGDGPERRALERLAGELGIADRVRFLGALPAGQLAPHYASCDLFVHVPREVWPDIEGFGMAYLEAALFGKPSVGSRAGGVPEAVLDSETGIIVPPDDAAALAAALRRLAEDPALRQRLGAQARRRADEEFRWEKQFAPLKRLLEDFAA